MKAAKHDRWARAGFGLWILYGLVLGALALVVPLKRSTIPFYAQCAMNFWAARPEPLNYDLGFYYLPAARVLFSPFAFAGIAVGGLLWRLFAYSLITLAALRWARLLAPGDAARAFALILVLTLPASAGVLRNGQFDGPAWALMALGAAAVAEGHWWRAAAALGLALAIKPTAIVAVLLMGTIWPPVGIRLLPIIAAALAIPYVNPNWAYVGRLYADWLHQTLDSLPQPGRWNDLANAFAHMGVAIPYGMMTIVRLLAAVAALAIGVVSVRRLPRVQAAFVVLMLTAIYLLLFNPRTLGYSYIGLAIIAAPIATRLALVEGRTFWSGAVAALAILPCVNGLTMATSKLFNIWLDPFLACVFLVAVLIPRALSPATWEFHDTLIGNLPSRNAHGRNGVKIP